MIKVVCSYCQEETDTSKDGYLEYNLNEKVIYFKCPHCKKTDKCMLYKPDKPYPAPKRM